MGESWRLHVLVVKDWADEVAYKNAFPGLFDDVLVVYPDEDEWQRKVEGLRVTRVFISHKVNPDSSIVETLHRALVAMPQSLADSMPIYLRAGFTKESRQAMLDLYHSEEGDSENT